MFKRQDLQMFCLNLNNYGKFHPLEVVGRGSETQLHVGEKLNYYKNRDSERLCQKLTQMIMSFKRKW